MGIHAPAHMVTKRECKGEGVRDGQALVDSRGAGLGSAGLQVGSNVSGIVLDVRSAELHAAECLHVSQNAFTPYPWTHIGKAERHAAVECKGIGAGLHMGETAKAGIGRREDGRKWWGACLQSRALHELLLES